MLFDDELDSVFGRPSQAQSGRSTTRSLFRQISKQNPGFKNFARDPFGRAILNTATLLARLSMENDARKYAEENDGIGSFPPTNTATRSGKLNSRSLEVAGADIVLDLVEGLVSQALARRKVTTSISESARSRETQKLWNSSRSDQNATLAKIVQRGLGQL